LSIEHETES